MISWSFVTYVWSKSTLALWRSLFRCDNPRPKFPKPSRTLLLTPAYSSQPPLRSLMPIRLVLLVLGIEHVQSDSEIHAPRRPIPSYRLPANRWSWAHPVHTVLFLFLSTTTWLITLKRPLDSSSWTTSIDFSGPRERIIDCIKALSLAITRLN